jgi:hypothetical protein
MTYLKKEKAITMDEFKKFKFEKQGWKFTNNKMVKYNQKITYEQVILFFLREKFGISDEISIIRQKETKPAEFEEYNIFVESCKTKAKNFIEERKLWML